MGYWFPTWDIAGGLYGGLATPSGDMTGFIDQCTSVNLNGNILTFTATRLNSKTNVDNYARWDGAFGSSDGRFWEYQNAHVNQGVQEPPWMIFTIANPEGVQYYKQELVIQARMNAFTSNGTYSGEPWLRITGEMVFLKAYRREYASPTAIPEVTHTFFQGTLGYPANRIIDGIIPPNQWLMSDMKFPCGYAEYEGKTYLCFASYQYERYEHYTYDQETQKYIPGEYYLYAGFGIDTAILEAAFGDFKMDENDDPNINPDPDDPGQDPDPGPGPRVKEYDPIPIPGLPDLDAIGAGFLTLYSPSKTTLNLLADEIFSNNILDIIKNYFASIQELIAGLSILPFHVPISGFAHHKIGLFTSTVQLPLVSSQFVEINCGSVSVNRYFNNFLDQSPNTKIMLWLPYIGYQQLDADEVMGNTITVKYHCDILSGACVAFIMIGTGGSAADTDRVIAQYSGNVITQVPVAAQSYDSLVSNAINILTAGVGIAAGAAIGGMGAAGGMASAAQATAGSSQTASAIGAQVGMGMGGTAANMVMSMKPTYSRNGTPGSTAGYMSVQKPYLIKIVPRDAVAPNHIQLKGYPSNYGGPLGSLSGYCEVSEIQLQSIPATVDELTEIYSLLKGGVVI